MMPLNNLLQQSAQEPLHVKGEWSVIQWTPDHAAGEKYNIGVAFKESGSQEISVSMLDYFERIKCLYDEAMIFHVQLACDVAREVLLRRHSIERPIGSNISFQHRGFAQGESTAQLLSQLYKTAIPLARKIRVSGARSFTTRSRDQVHSALRENLKHRKDFDFRNYAPVDPYHYIQDGQASHRLYLPFRKDNAVATLASAAYVEHQRVKLNLYDGWRDVDIAKSNMNIKEAAIFFLLPGDGLDRSRKEIIENEIDAFVWHMKKTGVHLGYQSDFDKLGDEVEEWCMEKVA
jgi:hypothetical protein